MQGLSACWKESAWGERRPDNHHLPCVVLLPQLPPPFDIEAIQAAYPTTYQDSMNTVLVQEAICYNALLEVLDSSLRSTLKALEGIVVMSPDLEKVANSLYDNQVGRRVPTGTAAGPSDRPQSCLVERAVRFDPALLDSGSGSRCCACCDCAMPRGCSAPSGARCVGCQGLPVPQAPAQLGGRPAGAPRVHSALGGTRHTFRLLDQRILLPSGMHYL